MQTAMSTIDKERASRVREQSVEYYERSFSLCDDFLNVMPEHKYAKDFVNMMGAVYFSNRKYDDLLEKFAGYENGVMNKKGFVNQPEFLKQSWHGNSHYMSGLALLATGRFDEAKPLFCSCWSKCTRFTIG